MSQYNQVNFLPDDFSPPSGKRRPWKLVGIICLIVVGVALGGAGAFLLVQKYKSKFTTASAAPAPTPAPYVESHIIEQYHPSDAPRSSAPTLAQISTTTTNDSPIVTMAKVPLSDVITDINNALPSGVTLLDVMLESKRLTTPAPGNDPLAFNMTIQITGTAHNDVEIAQFINRLGKSPILKNLNLLLDDQTPSADDKSRKFHLELGMDPASQPATTNSSTASTDPGSAIK